MSMVLSESSDFMLEFLCGDPQCLNCVFGPLLRSTRALELASVPEASAKTFEEVARRSGLDSLAFLAEPIDADS